MQIGSLDTRKRSFDNSIGKNSSDGNKHIKLESSTTCIDALIHERKKDNELLVHTSILNGKTNQLNALATIHATNVQRCNNSTYPVSDMQLQRLEKIEKDMDRLSDEIDQLNRVMQSKFGAFGTSDETRDDHTSFKTPNESSTVRVSLGTSDTSYDEIETPNVSGAVGVSRIISIDHNPSTRSYPETPMIDLSSNTDSIVHNPTTRSYPETPMIDLLSNTDTPVVDE